MKKFATIDQNGFPTGFYSEDVNDNIPEIAVEITHEQWDDLLSNAGLRKFEGGVVVPYHPPLGEADKAAACFLVDELAEKERLKYITAGAGQAMVYQRKEVEADKLQTDSDPDPANYPLLSSSIGIEGSSLHEIAQLVLTTRNVWLSVAASIEHIRLSAKEQINQSTDKNQIDTILASLVWPNLGA